VKKLLDANDPFFAPVWRRWATCALPLVWGAGELWMGNSGWGAMFLAAGAWAFFELILQGPKGSE
jgi:hypothetical protein